MTYRIACLLVVVSAAFAAKGPRVIDARSYHLGMAGMPEWQEFERSTPHGSQLELNFIGEANAGEATLFVAQRNVKTAWNVAINGRRLGALETLTQPLVLALAIPAGTLKDGDNKLTIVRPPSRMLDDVVVGEIAIDPRPRSQVLSEAACEIVVTDESNRPVPCRITFVDRQDALMPWAAEAGQQVALRTGVVYTGDGRARVRSRSGDYVVYANRGFEYSVASSRITLAAGANARVALQIKREVPTPGYVAADTHIHTLTFSKHGDATLDERMLTIAGEGIEVAVSTDHNHHADFAEPARRNGVAAHFTPVVGNEVTTKVGHFNAFPVPLGGPLPNVQLTEWAELLPHIRNVTGAKVIALNHPRDVHSNFTPFGPDNFDAKIGEFKQGAKFECDAIEVVTSAAMQSDILQLYHDWFALLNRGFRVAAIGSSDTHDVSRFILGQSRTYVANGAADPAAISIEEVCESYRRGRLLVSMGLLAEMTVNERFGVGDLATGLDAELRIAVRVLGPSWTRADRLELFVNGVKAHEETITPSDRVNKVDVVVRLPRPKHDVHLVAIATGPGVTAPYWEISRPYQPASKVFTSRVIGSTNPIWLDADGDGKFTPARGYAEAIVQRTAGDAEKVKAALANFDQAVAVQVEALIRR